MEAILIVGILMVLGIFGGAVYFAIRSGRRVGVSEFLCDTCKYNDPRDCSQPDRPNATTCPDYCV